ncbi:MAG: CRISPR-associated endonuclease Cas2, partial [Chloroflexaceae bacterium]|nr:CRISPR-associated endonuclease Cas2 [Chloroflexaceae bacterium]
MRVLVLYDISDDRARQRVADACLDYGLERVQFSVFVGALSRDASAGRCLGRFGSGVGRAAGAMWVVVGCRRMCG